MLTKVKKTNFIRRALNKKFRHKFTEEEIETAINRIIYEPILLDDVNYVKFRKKKKIVAAKNIL